MEKEFDIQMEQPLSFRCDETLFDKEKELHNFITQRALDLRTIISQYFKEKRFLTEEIDRIEEEREKEKLKILIDFANEFFELVKTIENIKKKNQDQELSENWNRLQDVQTRFQAIFLKNGISIEDPTGKMVDNSTCDVKGTVEMEGKPAGIIAEAYTPFVRCNEKIIQKPQVMVCK